MDRVIIEEKDGIAFVTLNRGDKHNCMDFDMLNAVVAAQRKVRRMKHVRAIILRGDGPSFCSGLDFKTFSKHPWRAFAGYLQLWLPWRNVFQKWSMGWRDIPVPVIALMHGSCYGAGLQLALGADIRICTPDAKLSIMEGKWGLTPDMGGVALLRELMPIDVAKELTMTARVFNGEDSKEIGLVTHLSSDPHKKAMEICEEITAKSPDSVGASKYVLQQAWSGSQYLALRAERLWQRRLFGGKNFRISVGNGLGKDKKPFLQRRFR